MAKKAAKRSTPKPRRAPAAKGLSGKHVYFFGSGKADGNRHMKDLLGGKGSGLAEMTNAGLPVPPGFTISTAVCTIYYEQKAKIPPAAFSSFPRFASISESIDAGIFPFSS